MDKKKKIRKSYFLKRKKKYFEVDKKFFYPLIKIILSEFKTKKIDISIYHPSSYEVNIKRIFDVKFFKKFDFYLPILENNNSMHFYKWIKNDILFINRYGFAEPLKSLKKIPNLVLLPLLAFDKNKNRIGYGKGFYDRYLNKYFKAHKKIVTVGVAFSFQQYNKLPRTDKDFKLDYIITEKGII